MESYGMGRVFDKAHQPQPICFRFARRSPVLCGETREFARFLVSKGVSF